METPVDETPQQLYLYPKFVLFQQLFQRNGPQPVIRRQADVARLAGHLCRWLCCAGTCGAWRTTNLGRNNDPGARVSICAIRLRRRGAVGGPALYKGLTTNARTPGCEFAPVYVGALLPVGQP